MIRRINLIGLSLFLFIIGSCTSDRFFEENMVFEQAIWRYEQQPSFTFVADSSKTYYDLKINLRYGLNYPYRNIYLEYSLNDESGNKLKNALVNYSIFDSKTGEPLGSNSGSIHTQRLSLLDSLKLKPNESYTLKIKQMMRVDSLKDVYSIGLRID